MSELYSVSLDHLLKEETSMKQTYREYLEESTNVVKSNEKKSKLLLTLTVLGIWALSLIAFALAHLNIDARGYGELVVGSLTKHDVLREITFDNGVFTVRDLTSSGEAAPPLS